MGDYDERLENKNNTFWHLFALIASLIGISIAIFAAYEVNSSNNDEREICEVSEEIEKTGNGDEEIGSEAEEAVCYKPVIYVYNNTNKDIKANVKIEFDNGELTCSYPRYEEQGWNIEVLKNNTDGTILNTVDNREYNYLYWEGNTNINYNKDKGFVVAGSETGDFLRTALEALGLNRKEANEFIVYWLPRMESNEYNYITFVESEYTSKVKLNITPKADNTLRVYMMFEELEKFKQVNAQNLEEMNISFEREGLTVIEWGGSEIKDNKIE